MSDINLGKLRKEIDELDQEILQIIAKRVEVVKKIGKLKTSNNIPFVDEKRRLELMELITRKAEEFGLSKEFIKKLYSTIHDHAVEIQKRV